METRLFKYIENFTTPIKRKIFRSDIFHILAQNTDCGYSLELPLAVLMSTHNLCFFSKIRKIMYTPVNPSFTIKRGV